ncbi:MAG: hypothetical protein JWM10_4098 [Myxococcaceae bacterium]|nr:hypothetical protein [Myxococcaceae bacterium]
MTPFAALEALRNARGWKRGRPSREAIVAHANALPWVLPRPDGVARGLWAARGKHVVQVFGLSAAGQYDEAEEPGIFSGGVGLDDLAPLVDAWLRLTPAGVPVDGWREAPVTRSCVGPIHPDTPLPTAAGPSGPFSWKYPMRCRINYLVDDGLLPKRPTLRHLSRLTAADLLSSEGFGKGSLEIVEWELARAGLVLRPEPKARRARRGAR